MYTVNGKENCYNLYLSDEGVDGLKVGQVHHLLMYRSFHQSALNKQEFYSDEALSRILDNEITLRDMESRKECMLEVKNITDI